MTRPTQGKRNQAAIIRNATEAAPWPLTAACRGVTLWLGTALAAVAGLTAAGLMRPAFPNEPAVVAAAFLLGSLLGAAAVWRREPAPGALAWALANALLAAAALSFPEALGLA